MSKDSLSPCPFCGNNNGKIRIRRMGNKGYRVVCGNCGACGPYVAIKEWHDSKMIAQGQAIKAWNDRKQMENIEEELRKAHFSIIDDYTEEYENVVFLGEAIEIVKAGGRE